MKLFDILVEKIDLSRPQRVQMNFDGWIPVTGDLIGKGLQARAYAGRSAGVVNKIAILDEELGLRDPAVKFLDIVLAHQNNPFFPRIYHARVYRDAEGIKDPVLFVQMEKLLPIDDEHLRDVTLELFKGMGLKSKLTKKTKETFRRNRGDSKDLDQFYDIDNVVNQFHDAIRSGNMKKLKQIFKDSHNPKLKEAIDILMPYFEKFGSDLHFGNWMMRLTGHGPQLVIIDPFTPSTYANV